MNTGIDVLHKKFTPRYGLKFGGGRTSLQTIHGGPSVFVRIETWGFSPKYDAYYCRECYAWLERHCGGEGCEYCASRPPANEDAKEVDENIEGSLFSDLVQEFGPRN